MDRRTANALDRWLTTEPSSWGDDYPECACGFVGEIAAPHSEDIPEYFHCDGRVRTYFDDYKGTTYEIKLLPCEGWVENENAVDHEPHDELITVRTKVTWACPECGKENVEEYA